MVTHVQTLESREDALRRLAQVARESGVKLLRDNHGEYWATSVSEPGWLYGVTPESCGCRGFSVHRRCRHVAALWSHLGYFDPEPEPPASPAACSSCGGTGSIPATISTGRSWRYGNETCTACHGTGAAVDTAA